MNITRSEVAYILRLMGTGIVGLALAPVMLPVLILLLVGFAIREHYAEFSGKEECRDCSRLVTREELWDTEKCRRGRCNRCAAKNKKKEEDHAATAAS